jgi:formylglycine-generating enzyme required for sulfatase activity
MTGEGMERRVLISHATDDPDWTPDQVEAVATAIQQAGIRVSLDLWHQRDLRRHLSLAEWQGWMDESIDAATHILCLVSTRYRELWSRKRDVQGGFGVAFEATRLIHHLYLLKQDNDGRILTLRPDGRGHDCIPRDLAPDCPPYRWVADRAMLLSHVGEAALPGHARATGAPPGETLHPPPIPPPPQQPRLPWASDSGEDEYGRWADLTVNGATQRMRWIPPTGAEGFLMGSPQAERDGISHNDVRDWANGHEHEPRKERVDVGVWLADTPCTQAFWQAVTGSNPSHFKTGADAPQRPVENVSWDAVMDQFIARLAARPGWAQGETVCLPSEVEWEYAARAGTTRAYWWGDEWDAQRGNADDTGLRDLDDAEGTSPVKRYWPNPWGLFDMHGTVWEWCEDVWCERRDAPEARPDADERVVRGGSWFSRPDFARAAYRNWGHRTDADLILGFRFALRSPAGPEAR